MTFRFTVALALSTVTVVAPAAVGAQQHAIDVERSTLTVLVYKAGLFSAFADNHVIRAPIAGGSISTDNPAAVELRVRAATLTVLDPGLSADKRADVQARMLGPEVLDSAKYPEITFLSTSIESAGADRWTVRGRLTIHGTTQSITFPVSRQDGRYRGRVALKQRDFGIQPISIMGGTVKVKDEVVVEFDIAAQK